MLTLSNCLNLKPCVKGDVMSSLKMHLTLILGPMFAGKSSAILSRVKRAKVLGWKTMVITCDIDKRYDVSGAKVMTHDLTGIEAVGVNVLEGVTWTKEYLHARLIVIEEAQFFPDLYKFVVEAVDKHGKDVVVVGLDGDSDRKPFGQILELVPLADEVMRLTSLCKRCGDGTAAIFTALVSGVKGEQVCVGGAEKYEPMCRLHYLINKQNLVSV
jgi:thymidine kinase